MTTAGWLIITIAMVYVTSYVEHKLPLRWWNFPTMLVLMGLTFTAACATFITLITSN